MEVGSLSLPAIVIYLGTYGISDPSVGIHLHNYKPWPGKVALPCPALQVAMLGKQQKHRWSVSIVLFAVTSHNPSSAIKAAEWSDVHCSTINLANSKRETCWPGSSPFDAPVRLAVSVGHNMRSLTSSFEFVSMPWASLGDAGPAHAS